MENLPKFFSAKHLCYMAFSLENGPYSLLIRTSYFISCSVHVRFASVLPIDCKWHWGVDIFELLVRISIFCIEAIELIVRQSMYYTF